MATTQMDGSTSVTATSTKNNGGASTGRGTSTANSKLDVIRTTRTQPTFGGSVVVDGAYTDEAISASVIAYNNSSPIGMRVSSTVSGQANTILRSGALVPSQTRSIHKRESFKVSKTATALRANYFSRYTGLWTTPPTSTTESPGADNAATPTRAVPGELVYKLGQPVPVMVDYSAKNT